MTETTRQDRKTDRLAGSGRDDIPGVILFPPLLYLLALLAGGLFHLVDPRPIAGHPVWRAAGALLAAAGVGLAVGGRRALERGGTTANPMRPVARLITDGPYRRSRNPMYLAMTAAYAGLALLIDSLWIAAMLVPLIVVLRAGVVGREERYLAARFGDEYAAYRRRTRRWI